MTCDPHSIPFFFNIDVRLESHLCCCFFLCWYQLPQKKVMYVYMYLCTYIYIHTYVYMCHIYIFIYLHIYHICYVYVCIYIYIMSYIYIYQVPKNWSIFWVWTGIPTWPIANYHWGSYLVIPLYIHIYIYAPTNWIVDLVYAHMIPIYWETNIWLDP